MARTYHGEAIREKQWQRMFRPNIRSVVPMNHTYLARTDGSELASGRGSGLDPDSEEDIKPIPKTPYMNMVFAPLERRLDTAIFRALFASSTRQARQFVLHGYVNVNGKKMIYPGYQLNPGDMFQVEPDRVLFATGATKDKRERRNGRVLRRDAKKDSKKPSSDESLQNSAGVTAAAEEAEPELPQDPKEALNTLLTQAKFILTTNRDELGGKKKRAIRAFRNQLKRTLSHRTIDTSLTDSLDAQLLELTAKLNISSGGRSTAPSSSGTPELTDASSGSNAPTRKIDGRTIVLPADERRILAAALAEAVENPSDPTKPYSTPWRPRDYMSVFAFVPRYLEVHHKICSAVYLRHPVARPGLAEVPTPFPPEVSGLAFNWYLRRR